MTYDEVLQAIHARSRFSSCASLDRISNLMHRLGDPQDHIRCIHVAGTNGKGSVCAFIESALRQAGYRVGLFTSPYLVDFRERIQINREMISKDDLISAYETVMAEEALLEEDGYEPINEFELVTAIGFTAFAKANVDYAVIEVGLGGRYDATNIIRHPDVCCITSISLDHTAVLGRTISEIAWEKAGIIKNGCPVVIAKQADEAERVFRREAEQHGSLLVSALPCIPIDYTTKGQHFRYHEYTLFIPLLGSFQLDNAAAAWEVCSLLPISPQDTIRGFSEVVWPGRLQYIAGRPDYLIDAGHNPAGIRALCDVLDRLFPRRRIICVMSMMADKDHRQCVPMVANRCDYFIAVSTGLPRSLSPDEMAAEAAPYCPARTADTVTKGLQMAQSLATSNDLILICGSVYGAGEAIRIIV